MILIEVWIESKTEKKHVWNSHQSYHSAFLNDLFLCSYGYTYVILLTYQRRPSFGSMEHCKPGLQDEGNLVELTWKESLESVTSCGSHSPFAKLMHTLLASSRSDLIKNSFSFVSCHWSQAASAYKTVSSYVNICILLEINRVRLVILVLPFIFCCWGMAGSQQTTRGNSALSHLSSGCRQVVLSLYHCICYNSCKNWYPLYKESDVFSFTLYLVT